MEKKREEGGVVEDERGAAIALLMEHTHFIPVRIPLSVSLLSFA